jgi:hypothetical protein
VSSEVKKLDLQLIAEYNRPDHCKEKKRNNPGPRPVCRRSNPYSCSTLGTESAVFRDIFMTVFADHIPIGKSDSALELSRDEALAALRFPFDFVLPKISLSEEVVRAFRAKDFTRAFDELF